MTATPLDISHVLAHPNVGALLHVGQPAVAVKGVGDVLFGVTPPAGRMIQTVYPKAYATAVSIFDFNMRPGPSAFPAPGCTLSPASSCPNGTNPGRTYRFYTGAPVVPFGYGLAYTTFRYKLHTAPQALSLAPVRNMLAQTAADGRTFVPLHAARASVPLGGFAVNVTNTGHVDSDDVVLGFVTPPNAGKDGAPLKSLFGFERVHVKAGATVTVWLYPALTDFAPVDAAGKRHATAGEYTISFGVAATAAHGMGFVSHRVVAS